MKIIWKYELEIIDYQEIQMPDLSDILCVQMQNNKPCLWVLTWPEHKKVSRIIKTIGTGHAIDDRNLNKEQYIGTYQTSEGLVLVCHVFVLNDNN